MDLVYSYFNATKDSNMTANITFLNPDPRYFSDSNNPSAIPEFHRLILFYPITVIRH
jgi:hypothetical protein